MAVVALEAVAVAEAAWASRRAAAATGAREARAVPEAAWATVEAVEERNPRVKRYARSRE